MLLVSSIYWYILLKQSVAEKHVAHLNLELQSLANLKQKSIQNFSGHATNSIKNLLISDNFFQNLFSTLSEVNHYEICFTEMIFQKNKFSFQGFTPTLEELSGFLQQWSGMRFFSEIKIKSLQPQKNNLIQFDIHSV